MPSWRGSTVRSEALLISALALWACDEKPAAGPAPARFAAVKKSTAQASATAFCDKRFPASGAEARAYVAPATRPFGPAVKPASGWTWVNVWATWCKPCVEEMGMLNRWREATERDGLDVSFTLLSIDETAAQAELEGWKKKNLPGPIQWIRSEADFGPFLDRLGVERDASIPIHALVDPSGQLRCVRVGAIHEENYGAVRALLSER